MIFILCHLTWCESGKFEEKHPVSGWSESYVKVVTYTIACNQDQLHISKPQDAASTGN